MPWPGLIQSIELFTSALDGEGIPYAVTGSVASSIHGEPFASIDVDVVVRMTPEQGAHLAQELGPRFYADPEMLRSAAMDCSVANVYDRASNLKIDVSVLADTPYHEQVLQRRLEITPADGNVTFWVVSAEDIILMKLVWRRHTRSQKQWDNALGVVRVQGGQLDWAYLRQWAAQLGIEADLDELAWEAGI